MINTGSCRNLFINSMRPAANAVHRKAQQHKERTRLHETTYASRLNAQDAPVLIPQKKRCISTQASWSWASRKAPKARNQQTAFSGGEPVIRDLPDLKVHVWGPEHSGTALALIRCVEWQSQNWGPR